jgi:hypothetical protein
MAGLVFAQSVEFSNARSMGMARASMVSARGLDAIGLNPANLGMADRSTLSVTMFPMGLHIGTNFLSWDRFKEYFSGVETDSGKIGRYLTESDKEDILQSIPGGTAKFIGGATITLFALSYIDESVGGIAFTINERMGASATIPDDYLRLLFYGNPVGSRYEFSGTTGNIQWTREYALHYGRSISGIPGLTSLSAGVSVKLLHGFMYGGIDDFSGMIQTDSASALSADLRYRSRQSLIDALNDTAQVMGIFPAPAGTGFGMDIGVSARIGQAFAAGVSVTDLGGITWTRNAREFHTDARVSITDPTSAAQRDSITDAFKTREYSVESFRTGLPTVLRIGVAVDVQLLPMMKAMAGRMVVELDYIQGLNTSAGNTRSPRFALGIDYQVIPWLPIRTGLAFGGNERVHWGLGGGFNFENFDLEVGTEDIIAILAPSVMSTASLAFGARLRF